MNSAVIWIIFPAVCSLALLFVVQYRRIVFYLGISISALLALAAAYLPIDKAFELGPISLKISDTISILGRRLTITSAEQTVLVMLFAISTFWLISGLAVKASNLLPVVALLMTAILTGSLAVKPFLYAGILIGGAVLVSIPLFPVPPGRKNPGVARYLVFQIIGLPFLLLTGWFLGGLQTGSADPVDVLVALVFLGLGFAFVLAIFPLYSWIPMLAEDEEPVLTGFIFVVLPSAILFSFLSYLDQYSWLRESVDLPVIFQVAGVLMIATGGIFSGFQKNLARMFGYAVIVENGLSVLSIGLMTSRGYELFAGMFAGRIFSFGLWALSLSLIRQKSGSLDLEKIRGLGREYPLLLISLLIGQFSIGGLPLLSGFPQRTAIIEELAIQSPQLAWLIIVGLAGIWAGAIFSLFTLSQGHLPVGRIWLQNRLVNILLLVGIVIIIFLGLFPHVITESTRNLLLPYTHLYGIISN